jgi:hypothetical protein
MRQCSIMAPAWWMSERMTVEPPLAGRARTA